MKFNLDLPEKGTKNLFVYLCFLLIALIGIFYGNSIKAEFKFLRIWDTSNILLLLLGVPFLFLFERLHIPNFWENKIAIKHKLYLPIAIGAVFGLLDIFVIKVLMHPEPYSSLPPYLQPFPYSFFLFFSGALEIEVFYRLIPISLILLLSLVIKKNSYSNYFFWIAAVLTAIREPLEQLPSEGTFLIIYSLFTGFLMNILQVIYFKKYGFLSCLFIRLGHYLFWHILLGVYVEFFELV
ncbi:MULTISPECIES: hypothetical protein [Flavobacterium]|uniref:CAAX protease self-immunity n=1 Tax=Flavobacterium keumense TaxID=1306518 RepID=A0ABY8N5V8_9FLAO|nr:MULTISPECIES: hypothetical protein [Flavobacterium]WGK95030.1 hypothetical protein MG292_02040 [Flavobacterium keumense]